jgi:hypothetical protein
MVGSQGYVGGVEIDHPIIAKRLGYFRTASVANSFESASHNTGWISARSTRLWRRSLAPRASRTLPGLCASIASVHHRRPDNQLPRRALHSYGRGLRVRIPRLTRQKSPSLPEHSRRRSAVLVREDQTSPVASGTEGSNPSLLQRGVCLCSEPRGHATTGEVLPRFGRYRAWGYRVASQPRGVPSAVEPTVRIRLAPSRSKRQTALDQQRKRKWAENTQ